MFQTQVLTQTRKPLSWKTALTIKLNYYNRVIKNNKSNLTHAALQIGFFLVLSQLAYSLLNLIVK